MSRDEYLKDIDYIKALAEEGANTPLLGGPIGLMWGILLSATFSIQWAVLSETIALAPSNLYFVWGAFALLGGLGCMILGRKIARKPGANSVANRVENHVWVGFSAMMITLFVGAILNMVLVGGSPHLFDLMVIVGFSGQGLAYRVVSKMSGMTWLRTAALANFVISATCFVAYGQPHIYLLAAIGIVLTVIVPSLITLKREPHDVV